MVEKRGGLSLAYVCHMNKFATEAFERADRLDPTLTLDGLTDFLPPELDSEVDPSLAVNTLQEFFAEEQPAPGATNTFDGMPAPYACDGAAGTDELEDYFRGLETAPELARDDRAAAAAGGSCVELAEVDENPGLQSEIQRAALEFQRFAEKFHAFASQCQRQRAVL